MISSNVIATACNRKNSNEWPVHFWYIIYSAEWWMRPDTKKAMKSLKQVVKAFFGKRSCLAMKSAWPVTIFRNIWCQTRLWIKWSLSYICWKFNRLTPNNSAECSHLEAIRKDEANLEAPTSPQRRRRYYALCIVWKTCCTITRHIATQLLNAITSQKQPKNLQWRTGLRGRMCCWCWIGGDRIPSTWVVIGWTYVECSTDGAVDSVSARESTQYPVDFLKDW